MRGDGDVFQGLFPKFATALFSWCRFLTDDLVLELTRVLDVQAKCRGFLRPRTLENSTIKRTVYFYKK